MTWNPKIVIEDYLKTRTPWQIVKLTLTIAILIGLLAGFAIGNEYSQIRILLKLDKTSHETLNYISIGDKFFEISEIHETCIPKWVTNDIANVSCALLNTRDNTTKTYYPINNSIITN